MKDPVCIFECRRGFHCQRLQPYAIASHAIGGSDLDYAGTNTALRVIFGERCVMPAWMEILINVIGYGGFIAIATYHRSPNENFRTESSGIALNENRSGYRWRDARLLLFSQNEQGAHFPALLPC